MCYKENILRCKDLLIQLFLNACKFKQCFKYECTLSNFVNNFCTNVNIWKTSNLIPTNQSHYFVQFITKACPNLDTTGEIAHGDSDLQKHLVSSVVLG